MRPGSGNSYNNNNNSNSNNYNNSASDAITNSNSDNIMMLNSAHHHQQHPPAHHAGYPPGGGGPPPHHHPHHHHHNFNVMGNPGGMISGGVGVGVGGGSMPGHQNSPASTPNHHHNNNNSMNSNNNNNNGNAATMMLNPHHNPQQMGGVGSPSSGIPGNGNSNNNNMPGSTQQQQHQQQQQQGLLPGGPGGTGGARACAGCGGRILDRYLLFAMERYWHTSCLKCSCCQAQLGEIGTSCYTRAGMILCRNDYARLFGAGGSCCGCGQPIPASELVMRAQTNVYHVKCFTCCTCHSPLTTGDRYGIVQGSLLCEHDFPKVVKGLAPLPNRTPHKVC